MTNTMLRRILAFLLTLIMLVSSLPVSLAEGTASTGSEDAVPSASLPEKEQNLPPEDEERETAPDEYRLQEGKEAQAATRTMLAAPLLGAEPTLNVEADGSKIETVIIRWLTPDDTVSGGTVAPYTDHNPGVEHNLYLAPKNDLEQKMQYQVDIALSGQYDYAEGEVQLVIPAQIFKTRDGQLTGTLTLSVPEAPSRNADFSYIRVGDNYIITNTRTLSAATKAMFQFTFRGLIPHTIQDMDTVSFSVDLNVTTHLGNTISKRSNELSATLDTYAAVRSAYKGGDLFTTLPANLPKELLKNLPGANGLSEDELTNLANEYVFVRWYTYVYHVANQEFSIDLSDAALDAYEVADPSNTIPAIMLGTTETDKRTGAQAAVNGNAVDYRVMSDDYHQDTSSQYDHVQYLWTAYRKSAFEDFHVYQMPNEATWTVTERDPETGDDIQHVTSTSARSEVRYTPQSFRKPIGHFDLDKWTERHNAKNWNYNYALNQLKDLHQNVDMVFLLESTGFGMPWTFENKYGGLPELDKDGNPVYVDGVQQFGQPWDNLANFGHHDYSMVTEDNRTWYHTRMVDGQQLTRDDFEIVSVRFTPITMFRYEQVTGTRVGSIVGAWDYTEDSSLEKATIQVWARSADPASAQDPAPANGTNEEYQVPAFDEAAWQAAGWVKYGEVHYHQPDNVQVIVPANGASANGDSLVFPANVTDFRTVVTTRAPGVEYDMYPTIRLKAASQRVAKALEAVFADSDEPTDYFDNAASMSAYELKTPDQPEYVCTIHDSSMATLGAAAYGVHAQKGLQSYQNDPNNRRVLLNYQVSVTEQSNLTEREDYDEAVALGIIPAETGGVWYDLLPPHVHPILDTVAVTREGDSIRAGYPRVIRNWRQSDRDLLVVGLNLTPTPVKYQGRWTDKPELTFQAFYAWEDLKTLGKDVTNYVAFETDSTENRFGTMKGAQGEPDEPLQVNGRNSTTPHSLTEEDLRLLKGLDPGSDPALNRFVYASAHNILNVDVFETAELWKRVRSDAEGIWTTGLSDAEVQVNVYEGQGYSYLLRTVPAPDTMQKDIRLLDALENYDPIYGATGTQTEDFAHIDERAQWNGVWLGKGRWRGTFEGLDLSVLASYNIKPVIYYNTNEEFIFDDTISDEDYEHEGLRHKFFSEGIYDFSNTANWHRVDVPVGTPYISVEDMGVPAGELVHAFVVDCSKMVSANGTVEDFVLSANEVLSVIVNMRAPVREDALSAYAHLPGFTGSTTVTDDQIDWEAANDPANNMRAFNNVRMLCTMINDGFMSTDTLVRYDYVRVGISPMNMKVEKKWDDAFNGIDDYDRVRPSSATVYLNATVYKRGTTDVIYQGRVSDYELLSHLPEAVKGAVVVSEDTQWKAEFKHLSPEDTDGNPVVYYFSEEPIDVQGLQNPYVPILSQNPNDSDEFSYLLTNERAADLADLRGRKVWNDNDNVEGVRPSQVTLHLSADGVRVKTITVYPDSDGVWEYNFTDMPKYRGDDDRTPIVYTVEEEYVPQYEGISTNPNSVINTHVPLGDLSVVKDVDQVDTLSSAAADHAFTFTVVLTREPYYDESGNLISDAPFVEDTPYYIVDRGAAFDPDNPGTPTGVMTGTNVLTFTMNRSQRFYMVDLPSETGYEVTEATQPGFTLISSANTSGQIRAGHSNMATATFLNRYRASGEAFLQASKQLTGRETIGMTPYQFRFVAQLISITGRDGVTSAVENGPTVNGANAAAPATGQGGAPVEGTVNFGSIRYTQVDAGKTFTYLISELQRTDRPGYTYDVEPLPEAARTVTVKVEDNGDGTLSTIVTYPNGQLPQFKNTYEAKGDVSVRAWKLLDGRPLTNQEFTFQLEPLTAGAPMPAGQAFLEAKNSADGEIIFPAIPFTQEHVTGADGEPWQYLIREIKGTDNTVIYTDQAFVYSVRVLDNGDGKLSFMTENRDAAANVGEPVAPLFVNELKPGGLTLTKQVQGDNAPDAEFTFKITVNSEKLDTADISFGATIQPTPAPTATPDNLTVPTPTATPDRLLFYDEVGSYEGQETQYTSGSTIGYDKADADGWVTRPGSEIKWRVIDGVLTITAADGRDSGTVRAADQTDTTGYSFRSFANNIRKAVVDPSVVKFGYSDSSTNGFKYMKYLQEVELPEGIEIYGSYFFEECASLQKVTAKNLVLTSNSGSASMYWMFKADGMLKELSLEGLSTSDNGKLGETTMTFSGTSVETLSFKDVDLKDYLVDNNRTTIFTLNNLKSITLPNFSDPDSFNAFLTKRGIGLTNSPGGYSGDTWINEDDPANPITIVGWNDHLDKIQPGSTWSRAKTYVDVQFQDNSTGSTVNGYKVSHWLGENIVLPDTAEEAGLYVDAPLKKWAVTYTNSSGRTSTVQLDPGEVFDLSRYSVPRTQNSSPAITITPVWGRQNIPVVVDPDGGVGYVPDMSLVEGQGTLAELLATLPNSGLLWKYGKNQNGWKVYDKDGQEIADPSAVVNNGSYTGSYTVKPVWEDAPEGSYTPNELTFTQTLRAGDSITLDGLPAGATFQIWEDTPEGWILVDMENASGTIQAAEEIQSKFINRYAPDVVQVWLRGAKYMDGAPAADADQFTFILRDGDGAEIATATNEAGGMFLFPAIEYENSGTYAYTIEEKPGDDATIEYDTAKINVTVNVGADPDTGKLTLEGPYYTDAQGMDIGAARFDNRTKPGSLTLKKTGLNMTEAAKDSEFAFRIRFRNQYGEMLSEEMIRQLEQAQFTRTDAPADTTANSGNRMFGLFAAPLGASGGSGKYYVAQDGWTEEEMDKTDGFVWISPDQTKAIFFRAAKDSNPGTDSDNLSIKDTQGNIYLNGYEKGVIFRINEGQAPRNESSHVWVNLYGNIWDWRQPLGSDPFIPNSVTEVEVVDPVRPVSMVYWFRDSTLSPEFVSQLKIDTSKCEDMTEIFYNAFRGQGGTLDLSSWDVSSVTTVGRNGSSSRGGEFFMNVGVEELNLSGWDLRNLPKVSWRISNTIKKIDLSGFKCSVNDSSSPDQWTGLESVTVDQDTVLPTNVQITSAWDTKIHDDALDKDIYYGGWTNGIDKSGGVTLTADELKTPGTWERKAISHNLVWDLDGGMLISGNLPTEQTQYADIILPDASQMYRQGCTFAGWQKKPIYAYYSGTATKLNGGTVMPWNNLSSDTQHVEMKALWTPIPGAYSIVVEHQYENNYYTTDREKVTIRGLTIGDTNVWIPARPRGYYVAYTTNLNYSGIGFDGARLSRVTGDPAQDNKYYISYLIPGYTVYFNGNTAQGGSGQEMRSYRPGEEFILETPSAYGLTPPEGKPFIGWQVTWNGQPAAEYPYIYPAGTKMMDLFNKAAGVSSNYWTGYSYQGYWLEAQWGETDAPIFDSADVSFLVKLKPGETVSLSNLPAGIYWEIEEGTLDDNGGFLPGTLPGGWTLEKIDNETGKILPNGDHQAQAVNRYDARGSVALDAAKLMQNGPLEEGAFTFELKPVNGAPMPGGVASLTAVNGPVDENETIIDPNQTVTEDTPEEDIRYIANPNYGKSVARLGAIPYTLKDLQTGTVDESKIQTGTYTFSYTLREVKPANADPALEYDEQEKTVLVTVKDNGKGELEATVSCTSPDGTEGNVFTNRFKPAHLKVKKNLTGLPQGSTGADKTFTFLLTLEDEFGEPITDTIDGLTAYTEQGQPVPGAYTFTITGDGEKVLDNLPHKATYTLTEIEDSIPAGFVAASAQGATGTLDAALEEADWPQATFTNLYEAKGSLAMQATKQLRSLGEDKLPEMAQDAMQAVMDAWMQEQKEAFLNEKRDEWRRDQDPMWGAEQLPDDAEAEIQALWTPAEEQRVLDALTDEERQQLENSAYLDFEFDLLNSKGEVLGHVYSDLNGRIILPTLHFDAQDVGTQTYTLHERGAAHGVEELEGYTYDETVYTINVKVTDNGDGTLNAEIDSVRSRRELPEGTEIAVVAADGLVFDNRYTAKGSLEVAARKELKGRELRAGQFSFQLTGKLVSGGAANESVPMPERTTMDNSKDGEALMGAIAFDERHVGRTYEYTLKEIKPDNPLHGMEYDEHEKTWTVYVEDAGHNVLRLLDGKDGQELADKLDEGEYRAEETFINTYTAEGQVELNAVKKMENRQKALKKDEFTFLLLDGDGQEVARATNDASGAVKFTVQYTQDDLNNQSARDITYTIREIAEAGKPWIGFDGTSHQATVTLTDDGQGRILTQVTYAEDEAPTFINTFEPGETQVEGSKVWDDNNDQDGVRPESITIHLKADGKEVQAKTVRAADGWKWKFDNLPVYTEEGDQIIYTFTEDAVDNYTHHIDGNTGVVTNRHKPVKTNIEVEKVWDDQNNQDGKRPESVTVHLYADGKDTGLQVILSAANAWHGSFKELDDKRNGQKIAYTVQEDVPEGYTASITGSAAGGYVLTNLREAEETEITVRKEWNDAGHEDARPESITVRLHANGVEIDFKEMKKADNWAPVTFEDLPVYEAGQKIVYTVTEDAVENYTHHIDEMTGVITNTYTPGKTSVEVEKVWNDQHNQDGKRPESVTVHLYADGKDTGLQVILSAANAWHGSFEELDDKQGGQKIAYTVQEDVPEGYTVSITGSAAGGYVLTNLREAEETEITVRKEWNDAGHEDARPESITVRLHANGVEIDSAELTADTGWKAVFAELPVYRNGVEIIYTITEEHVPDYTHHIDEETYTITNTYNPQKTDVEVEKNWEMGGHTDVAHPSSVTVRLLADGEDTGMRLELNAENKWFGEFENVDLKKGDKLIVYTVEEVEFENYVSHVVAEGDCDFLIVNKYIQPEPTPTPAPTPTPVPTASATPNPYVYKFTFTKKWQGDIEDSIEWTFYGPDGKTTHKWFNKRIISENEWRYEGWFADDGDYYLIENVPQGYKVRYENVGKHAGETDRCYNGGTIINYKIPKTGDQSNLLLWLGCALLSLGVVAVMAKGKRGRRKNT